MIIMALFIRLIIRTFQFVFSVGTVFFFHNKSANSVFQPTYQHNRTGMFMLFIIYIYLIMYLCGLVINLLLLNC
jgi:hypothetical protein